MGKPFAITLFDETEAKLRAVCARREMSMRGLMSKLVEWFVTLDATEQALILDQVAEEDRADLLRRVLSRRAVESKAERARANAEYIVSGKRPEARKPQRGA